MKSSSIIFSCLSVLFLSACNNSASGTATQNEEEVTSSLTGVYTQNNDTLRIIAKTDGFGKTIEFDINATRDEAELMEQSNKMEHYRLKDWISGDSSYVAYELLDFTFDFASDSWTLVDTIIITDHTAIVPNFVNSGGTYTRVK